MTTLCCEFIAPIHIGDVAAVVTIEAGEPDDVTGILISSEGCECGYHDAYSDYYCNITEDGLYPFARATSTQYEVLTLPAGTTLVIDSVEQTVRVLQGTAQVGGLEVLGFSSLFEWITAARGACARVCIDPTSANLNPDTTVKVETYQREL